MCLFDLFHYYLTSSILTWGRVNGTTLSLIMFIFQSKGVKLFRSEHGVETNYRKAKCKILNLSKRFYFYVSKFNDETRLYKGQHSLTYALTLK